MHRALENRKAKETREAVELLCFSAVLGFAVSWRDAHRRELYLGQ